jgi:undecaprenyl-diphosphatase
MNLLIVFTGQYLIFIIGSVALAATLLSKKTMRNSTIVLAIPSFLIALAIATVAGRLYYDPRPFVTEHTTPLIPHSADNGFPSEHTLFAMVTAITMFIYSRKIGILLGILSILVGVARVIAGIHHPIDIIGSVVIAIAAVCIAWAVLKVLSKKLAKPTIGRHQV